MITHLLIETVIWTFFIGAFLSPILFTIILVVAATWWTKQLKHKLTSAASPPSR
jgi:RsiW-degrading membrane proteinase PrsW (M82 family)